MDYLGEGEVDTVNELFVSINCCLNEVILIRCMSEFKGFGISSMELFEGEIDVYVGLINEV